MRTYLFETEFDITDIVLDLGLPMPPITSCADISFEVNVYGSDTPAIMYPNDRACPAEYRETETDWSEDDIAEFVLTFYKAQLSAAGIAIDAHQAADLLKNVKVESARIVEEAKEFAIDRDSEPPDEY